MRNTKPENIFILTLGCSKNTVDSEILMRQLEENNLSIVADPEEADTIIINTCGFIDAAKEESINTILEASELKKSGQAKRLFVAGCLPQRYRKELEENLPEVDRFFGVVDYKNITEELGGDFKKELLGERCLTTPSHYAYLKISEGCDNPCSFCAIPLIRGKHTSKPFDKIIQEASYLSSLGVKELIIIGQDTTYYGIDLYGKRRISELIARLADIEGIGWIRLMYAYPAQFPMDVLEVIKNHANICKYIDIPIQHIADEVLRSMRRGISQRATIELVKRIRDSIPNIALRTSLIVGYPTETEAAFELLCAFVEDTKFDRLGVFTYSFEEHTTAAPFGDPISQELKDERRSKILELQRDISFSKNIEKVGTQMNVLLDRTEGDFVLGRTEFDAPEVDNEILIPLDSFSQPPLIGTYITVTITEAMEYDLFGTIVR